MTEKKVTLVVHKENIRLVRYAYAEAITEEIKDALDPDCGSLIHFLEPHIHRLNWAQERIEEIKQIMQEFYGDSEENEQEEEQQPMVENVRRRRKKKAEDKELTKEELTPEENALVDKSVDTALAALDFP